MEVVSEIKRAAHYTFFDKIPCDNIDDNELHEFRRLTKLYAELSVEQVEIYYDK